jgi:hypothetical protein
VSFGSRCCCSKVKTLQWGVLDNWICLADQNSCCKFKCRVRLVVWAENLVEYSIVYSAYFL